MGSHSHHHTEVREATASPSRGYSPTRPSPHQGLELGLEMDEEEGAVGA
jgi:hypothetical protein